MARKLRIDSIAINGGSVSIGITCSDGAMPTSPSKQNLSFRSKAELVDAVKSMESRLSAEDLLLLAVATAYKADNTMTLATLQSLVGKTVAVATTSDNVLVRVS